MMTSPLLFGRRRNPLATLCSFAGKLMSHGLACGLLVVLAGCSVAAHTPTVAVSATGLDRSSLADTEPYASLVDRTVVLSDSEDRYWTLREFSSGDRFLQYSPQLEGASYSSQLVERLDGRSVTITEVYFDKINGGEFFDGLLHGDGEPFAFRRARWTDALLEYPRGTDAP